MPFQPFATEPKLPVPALFVEIERPGGPPGNQGFFNRQQTVDAIRNDRTELARTLLEEIIDRVTAAPSQEVVLEWLTSLTMSLGDDVPAEQVADDVAVERFAAAMKQKLAKKRAQGHGGWETCPHSVLSTMLVDHVAKGDPIDVANFAMMLWTTNGSIAPVNTATPTLRAAGEFALDRAGFDVAWSQSGFTKYKETALWGWEAALCRPPHPSIDWRIADYQMRRVDEDFWVGTTLERFLKGPQHAGVDALRVIAIGTVIAPPTTPKAAS